MTVPTLRYIPPRTCLSVIDYNLQVEERNLPHSQFLVIKSHS